MSSEAHELRCPSCGSSKIHRSRIRSFFERVMQLTGWRVSRCHNCQIRFFRRGCQSMRFQEAPRLYYRVLFVGTALGLAAVGALRFVVR
jgi:hypothetical protein